MKFLFILLLVPVVLVGLKIAYVYLGTISGFFEWRDAWNVRHYKLAAGKSLSDELEARLQQKGVQVSIQWSAACYGPVATITACLNGENSRCLAFDYDHDGHVIAGNRIARYLFPELGIRRFQYGTSLDDVGTEALKSIRPNKSLQTAD